MFTRLALLLLLLPSSVVGGSWISELREGDIIFHTSQSAQSLAVQRATGSVYSHMGVVLFRNGQPFVFEAISTVRYTPVRDWVARGKGRHFVVKRLRKADSVLTVEALKRLHLSADSFQGKSYDLLFGWSDETIYCSELVWKLYDRALGIRLCNPRNVGDFNLSDPLVQKKAKERYGSSFPVHEPAVAPSDIFASSQLITVVEQ